MKFPKLEDFDSQDEFEAAMREVVESEVGGLKSKKEALEGEIVELKNAFAPFRDLDPGEVKSALKDAARIKEEQALKAGEWEQLRDKMRDDHRKELEKKAEEIHELRSGNDDLRRKTAIEEAIRSTGIAKPFVPAVEAMLKTQIVIDEEDGKRIAKIGDKSPAEYLSEFVGTEDGKHYVSADVNGGGGAPGSGVPGYKGPNPFDPKAPNITEQMKMKKENPDLADKLQKQAGRKGGQAPA